MKSWSQIEFTLADTGLCALDVIYESADPRRLEQRVRGALPQLSIETPLDPAFADTRELAAAWRAVLVSARPARPTDLSRPNDQTLHTVSASALDAVKARAQTARGGLAARQQALADALAPPDGTAPDPIQVAIALEGLGAYGVVQPMIEGENFRALASVAAAGAARRVQLADDALAGDFDLAAAEAVSQAIFGDGFWMIPAIDPPAEGDLFTSSLGLAARRRSAARRSPPFPARHRFGARDGFAFERSAPPQRHARPAGDSAGRATLRRSCALGRWRMGDGAAHPARAGH